MKRSRKALIIVAVLAIVVAAALALLWTNVDRIVKAAIERYGSQATKTAVRVSQVTIRLASGEGAIAGLTVANPRGFSSPHVFRLGSISTRIDTRTVASSPIVIDEVRISAPEVVYEMDASGSSNINALKRNIQGLAAEAPEKKKAGARETKLRIRRLVIESGRIDVRVPSLSEKTLTLRRIELSNIGARSGATPGQVAEQVLTALAEEVGREVARAGAEWHLRKGINGAVRRLLEKPR
jgi:uncharacterized protein involved in outer membrane biogenesis